MKTRALSAAIAAVAAVLASPGQARADHQEVANLAVFGSTIAHVTLMPAYLSTAYYAWVTPRPMSVGWVTANVLTAAVAGSLGGMMIGTALSSDVEVDHGPVSTHATDVFLGIGGGLAVAGALTVGTASILYALRSDTDEPVARVVVAPMVATSPKGAKTGGLMLAGAF